MSVCITTWRRLTIVNNLLTAEYPGLGTPINNTVPDLTARYLHLFPATETKLKYCCDFHFARNLLYDLGCEFLR